MYPVHCNALVQDKTYRSWPGFSAPAPGGGAIRLPGLPDSRPLRTRSPDRCAASPPGMLIASGEETGLHAIARFLNQLFHLRGDFAVPHLLPVARLNLLQGHAH